MDQYKLHNKIILHLAETSQWDIDMLMEWRREETLRHKSTQEEKYGFNM